MFILFIESHDNPLEQDRICSGVNCPILSGTSSFKRQFVPISKTADNREMPRCQGKIPRKDSRPPARHSPLWVQSILWPADQISEYSECAEQKLFHPLQTGMSQIQAQHRWTADNAPPSKEFSKSTLRRIMPGRPFSSRLCMIPSLDARFKSLIRFRMRMLCALV